MPLGLDWIYIHTHAHTFHKTLTIYTPLLTIANIHTYSSLLHTSMMTMETMTVTSMLTYSVPGFCHEVIEALKILDMHGNDITYLSFDKVKLRGMCKERLVKLQGDRLIEDMVSISKCDSTLLQEFLFDGKMKEYLYQLPFDQARIVFMLRSRMFPTKLNFKGRWGNDECEFCRIPQNDKHLFSRPAYIDLTERLSYMNIVGLKLELDKLYEASVIMERVKERLEVFNN